ncbi:DNA primase DnaG [Halococcoides cellulosivorans]|uniref:DNA primase DnaG n=1 Tax=Halococcoides cellulosivorans TaxID=1679096 RepID=A0A2R4X1Q6_9EURY|nr:DNA primase DnaG [Halococcoides cellulosivorans]AWB27715.1 DNA primase [Halococcoides cellulosivorans]
MDDSAKYLIHASIETSGVVERSDVVGAVFGQTEGLLGDQLDLRELQDSSKLGRIDVEISSDAGRSIGTITIASGLDRVETAILAAALESIDRVGPCRATIDVDQLEDVRSAKRRAIVDRATSLLADFDAEVLSSREIVDEVRQRARVAEITDYEGYPAGPRVADSDAIIVVEGRADVQTLLRYGIKNAIAVEGTNIPDAVAGLTQDRTVTAFFDGDRGGDLLLRELEQVGSVDYVTFAPHDRCVEDLTRDEVLDALREKAPIEQLVDVDDPRQFVRGPEDTDGSGPDTAPEGPEPAAENGENGGTVAASDTATADSAVEESGDSEAAADATDETDTDVSSISEGVTDAPPEETRPQTVGDHVTAVIDGSSGLVRMLDPSNAVLDEREAEAAFDALREVDPVPQTVVLDGTFDQRLLDVAAQRGVDQAISRTMGEFVKQPIGVRLRTAAEF